MGSDKETEFVMFLSTCERKRKNKVTFAKDSVSWMPTVMPRFCKSEKKDLDYGDEIFCQNLRSSSLAQCSELYVHVMTNRRKVYVAVFKLKVTYKSSLSPKRVMTTFFRISSTVIVSWLNNLSQLIFKKKQLYLLRWLSKHECAARSDNQENFTYSASDSNQLDVNRRCLG